MNKASKINEQIKPKITTLTDNTSYAAMGVNSIIHDDDDLFRQLIVSGATALDISVRENHIRQFLLYKRLLIAWNKKTNLTRITTTKEIAVKHFLDSMAAFPYLPEEGRLLDIGSGGGFPGLVLKIMRPGLTVTLVDSVRKKVSFLQHVIRTLQLKGVTACHVRAEDFAKVPSETGRYQAIVSRALTTVDEFVRLSEPFVASDGMLVAYKSGSIEKELAVYTGGRNETGAVNVSSGRWKAPLVQTYLLPHLNIERTLIFFHRE